MTSESWCPACGKAGVVMSLDYTLLETSPTVRPHACGVGGPGGCDGYLEPTEDAASPDYLRAALTGECCASGRCEVCTPGFDWGRDG